MATAGRLWVATRALCVFRPGAWHAGGKTLYEAAQWWQPAVPNPSPSPGQAPACWGRQAGVEAFRLVQVAPTRDREVWLATTEGLFRLRGTEVERLGGRAGLADERTTAVLEDDGGNVWIGSERRGLMCLRRGALLASSSRMDWPPRPPRRFSGTPGSE